MLISFEKDDDISWLIFVVKAECGGIGEFICVIWLVWGCMFRLVEEVGWIGVVIDSINVDEWEEEISVGVGFSSIADSPTCFSILKIVEMMNKV